MATFVVDDGTHPHSKDVHARYSQACGQIYDFAASYGIPSDRVERMKTIAFKEIMSGSDPYTAARIAGVTL